MILEFSHELGIPEEEAGEKGLKLLMMLSYVYPGHFLHEDILLDLVSFLDVEENSIAPNILAVLTFVGKHKSLSKFVSKYRLSLCSFLYFFCSSGFHLSLSLFFKI